MKLNFQNRIALYYSAATALLIGLVFLVLYGIVHHTVYRHLSQDLETEVADMISSVGVRQEGLYIQDEEEWAERHHQKVEVNPVFMQVSGLAGEVVRKSVNLQQDQLLVEPGIPRPYIFNTTLAGAPVRQIQHPVRDAAGQAQGYLSIAIPLQESAAALTNLRRILALAFPLVVGVLFWVARLTAGQSIAPIHELIHTARQITRENLATRMPLPANQDELYDLSVTLNDLLDRLEQALVREKRFTADASHQLRTPLTVIKGTLEVLVRHPREPEVYAAKVGQVIAQINRMVHMVDQLLVLTRYEAEDAALQRQPVALLELAEAVWRRLGPAPAGGKLHLVADHPYQVMGDPYLVEMILENLLGNARKYAPQGSDVTLRLLPQGPGLALTVSNPGPPIPVEEQDHLFDRFYRGRRAIAEKIPGDGLGLSIVKRLAGLHGYSLQVQSSDDGTHFTLGFPERLEADSS